MEVRATSKYVRITSRKVRRVANLVRGKKVEEALFTLKYLPHRGARILEKVISSAQANAEHNHKMDKGKLHIVRAYVDQGPTLKRFRPRAMGRASPILKRTSHITVVVGEGE